MMRVGFIGWRGMVGSVLMQRMQEEGDFARIDPVFFTTSAVGGKGLKEGIVEVKLRTDPKEKTERVPVADAAKRVETLVKGLLDAARTAADSATA